MKTISLKHHFLIAMPALKDTNFAKSVIYLYEHNDQGAMGLVINKPLQINLGNILRHLKIDITEKNAETKPILMGGPVGQENGFVLYMKNNDIIITASKEVLSQIATGNGPEKYLVTLGYAGWNAGQLETELSRNDWLIAPFKESILFFEPFEERWAKAASLIGVNVNNLSHQTGHA